jgi:hypothetical protein
MRTRDPKERVVVNRIESSAQCKDPDAVPILKYGPNNNFMRFQEALSKKALEEYGALWKSILKGKIGDPVEPDKADFDLSDEYDKVAYLEELKLYQKLKNE